jgi:DNA (cytosine-5)-methyltransferase 1
VGSVSKALAYGVALLVQRACGVVAGVKWYRPESTKVIEGRTVNQRERWVVSWYETGNRSAYISGAYGWKLVRSSRATGEVGRVFNISVADDESYVADGAVVHNCQPHSLAGKRLAEDDERDLWGTFRRILVQCGAWWCLVENVEGMLSSGGAERVRGDLWRMGFEPEAGLFTAEEIGLPQIRPRFFILAVAHARCAQRFGQLAGRDHEPELSLRRHLGGCGEGVAHPGRDGQFRSQESDERPVEPEIQASRRGDAGRRDPNVADAENGNGRRRERGAQEATRPPSVRRRGPAVSRRDVAGEPVGREILGAPLEWASEHPLFPPRPGDAEAWRLVSELAPERLPAVSRYDLFSIALRKACAAPHGDPSAWEGLDEAQARGLYATLVQEVAQSTLRRVADGMASRVDELRLLGNGVVDLEGAYAVRTLAHRLAARDGGGAELLRMMGEIA